MMLTLIVAGLVLFSPLIAREILEQNSQLSEETYYNLRITEQIRQTGEYNRDILQNRAHNFNLFHYIFSKTNTNLEKLSKYLPALLGILSLFLVYLLLKALNLGQNDIFFAIIILATTPIFLYKFTTFNPEIIGLPILLIGLIFAAKGNYFSALFLGITAFFNIFYTILGILFLVAEYILKKKDKILLLVNAGAVFVSVIVGVLLLRINYLTSFISPMEGLNGFLVEFGAINGYAIVALGLTIIGLFSWWDKKSSKTAALTGALLLIIVAIFFEDIRLVVGLLMAVFAGISISYLVHREWEIHMLKDATLLLIICILLFSAVLTINFQIKNIEDDRTNAIKYLSSAGENDIILSSERNGFLIEYEAKRSAYIDGKSYEFSDYEERLAMADSIYYARNLKELEDSLKQEKITHILVDTEMKSGEVWNGRYEGLLFFLENSEKFIKIYYDNNIQIYRYVGDEIK